MKKTLIILMAAVCLFATLLVSCSNETKLNDEIVSIRFGFDQSRGLTASQDIPDVDSLYWYYKAKRTAGSDSEEISYGAKTTWTRVNSSSTGLNGIITLAQGRWDFELQGRKTTYSSTAVYQGSISNVLIYRNGDNVNTIEVPVTQLTSGNGSVVISSGIKVKKNTSETYTTDYKPTHYKFKATADQEYGIDTELSKDEEGALVNTTIPLPAGTYDFVVMYKGRGSEIIPGTQESIIYASAPITVTVSSNLETIITGSLDVVTASAEFAPQVDGTNTASVTPSATDPITVFVPITPSEEQGTGTTVVFGAGALPEGTSKVVTEVKTIDEAQSANFKVTDGSVAVAAIDLKITNDSGVVQTINAGKTVTVTTYIMRGLNTVNIKYNGTLKEGMTQAVSSYNSETGELVFTTNHFSEFFVESDAVCYNVEKNIGYVSLYDAKYGIKDESGNTVVPGMTSGNTITLLKDINIEKDEIIDNGVDGTWTYISYIKYFYGKLDGNGHKLYIDFTLPEESLGMYGIPFLFGDLYGEVKNLEVHITGNGSMALNIYGSSFTYDSVDVYGDNFYFGNNSGVYVFYDYADKLYIKNCDFYGKITGTGDKGTYDAIYVGYCFNDPIYFENCHNKGSIVLGKAVMFVGNVWNKVKANIIINNCSNDGIVHWVNYSDSLGDSGWYNQILAGSAQCIGSVTIDGQQCTTREQIANIEITTSKDGKNIWGPQDENLKIEVSGDVFKITPSVKEDVAYYEVVIGVYGGGNGSLLYRVKERIDLDRFTNGYANTELKDIPFADSNWLNNHSDAALSTIAGNKVYTYESNSYYYFDSTDYNLGSSGIKQGSIFGVSAYDKDGKVIASASLSK